MTRGAEIYFLTLLSQLPGMPGMLFLSVYCQKAQVAQPFGIGGSLV
jgi:hypothetical protein